MTNESNKISITDPYFGELVFVQYENPAVIKLAKDYFGQNVTVDYLSLDIVASSLLDVKGFVNVDGLRIPFKYCQIIEGQIDYSFSISLYYDVVYTRDEQLNPIAYHIINSDVNNVLKQQVEEYTEKLIERLPNQHSIGFSGVMDSLYFYPYIDKKNGKSLSIKFDIMRNQVAYFINHYQSVSKSFYGSMKFYYDGDSFSITSQDFTIINTRNIEFKDFWKHLMAKQFKQNSFVDLMNIEQKTLNQVLEEVDRALEVVEMIKI